MNRSLILFGAGKRGIEALRRFGSEKVSFFCDNSLEKQGSIICGIKVISFDELIEIYSDKYIVMVTLGIPCFVIGQLENAGIYDYVLYQDCSSKVINYDGYENDEEREHNNMLREYASEAAKEDLLENVEEFKKLTRTVIEKSKKKGILLNYITRGDEEEGYRYGNLQTLLRYAKISRIEGSYAPTVSHSMSEPIFSPMFEYKTAVFIAGDYFKPLIHKRAPWVPVFTVGPYLHYANGIYNSQKMRDKKREIGSMLLAFLPHTLENAKRTIGGRDFIDSVKTKYGNDFSQIWLCVYFADINDEVCEYAQKEGFHIVSAGFRFDPLFNERLKTIIQLSDAVVCGDIGGFLTYSLYLKKPIARIELLNRTSDVDMQYDNEVERSIEKTEDYINFEKAFYSLFDDKFKFDERLVKWMDPLGGYTFTRDPKCIKKMFDISNDIWRLSGGDYRKYPDSVREAYYKYNENNDIEKVVLLSEAVGPFVN